MQITGTKLVDYGRTQKVSLWRSFLFSSSRWRDSIPHTFFINWAHQQRIINQNLVVNIEAESHSRAMLAPSMPCGHNVFIKSTHVDFEHRRSWQFFRHNNLCPISWEQNSWRPIFWLALKRKLKCTNKTKLASTSLLACLITTCCLDCWPTVAFRKT